MRERRDVHVLAGLPGGAVMTFDEFFSVARNEADPEREVTFEKVREDLRKIYEEFGVPVGWKKPYTAEEIDGIVYIRDADGWLIAYCPPDVFEKLEERFG